METLERRVLLSSSLLDVSHVFLERVEDHGLPGDPTEYVFELGVELNTVDQLASARFSSPGGTFYDLIESFDFDGGEAWEYELASDVEADLADFTDGTYTLELTFDDGGFFTTDFLFADPGDASALTMPAQTPTITGPADGATDVAHEISITWDAATDPDVNEVIVDVDDITADHEVFAEDLDAQATQSSAVFLGAGGAYEAIVGFVNGFSGLVNDDGVAFEIAMINEAAVSFTTAEAQGLDLLLDVGFNRFVDHGQAGDPVTHGFEFVAMFGPGGAPDALRLQLPDASFVDLFEAEQTPEGDSVWAFVETSTDELDVAEYTHGTYTLELDRAGDVTTTDFFFGTPGTSDALDAPTDVPNITFPADGATDVQGETDFAWDAATDPNVTMIALEVTAAGDVGPAFPLLFDGAATGGVVAGLQPLTDYDATLSFSNAYEGEQNGDGIFYRVANSVKSGIAFSTADFEAPGDPGDPPGDPALDALLGVSIERLVDYGDGTGPAAYIFEFAMDVVDGSGLSTAQVIDPSQVAHALVLVDDGENDDRWAFEFASETESDLDPFVSGDYTLVLDFDGNLVETDFFFGMPGTSDPVTLITEAPNITSPVDGTTGEPAGGFDLQWDAPVDTAINNVSVELFNVDLGFHEFGFDLPADQTSVYTGPLATLTNYEAMVEFGSGADGQNADGVWYEVGSFALSSVAFTTNDEAGEPIVEPGIDNVTHVWIEKFVDSFGDFTEYGFEFGFGLVAGSPLQVARFQAPDGAFHVIDVVDFGEPPLEEGDETGPQDSEWRFEFFSDVESDLDIFGDGNYLLELDFGNDVVLTTEFTFGIPGTSDPIADIAQVPNITFPADGAVDVPTTTDIAWDAVTDPNVTEVSLHIIDVAFDFDVVDLDLPADSTGALVDNLAPGTEYEADLEFSSVYEDVNSDGVAFEVGKSTASGVLFATAGDPGNPGDPGDPSDPGASLEVIAGVFVERVRETTNEGLTFYEFSFEVDLFDTQGVTAVSMTTPGGALHDLVFEPYEDGGVGGSYEFEFESSDEADLADFVSGVYTLELHFGEESVSTDIFFGNGDTLEALPDIAQTPNITSPIDGSDDVPADGFDLTWDAVTDPNVDSVFVNVENLDFDVTDFEVDVDPEQTSVFVDGLAPGELYEAEVEFGTRYEGVNTDGVFYEAANFAIGSIEFATAGDTGEPGDPGEPDGPSLAVIAGGGIVRSMRDGVGEEPDEHAFRINVDLFADSHVVAMTVEAPDGSVHGLLVDEGDEVIQRWSFAVESTDAAELTPFGAGTYTLSLTFENDQGDQQTLTTDVVFGDEDGGALPEIAQMPAFTNPIDGATDVPADGLELSWEAITDEAIDEIFLELINTTFDVVDFEGFVSPEQNSLFVPFLPFGEDYEATLSFGSTAFVTNDDGVGFFVGSFIADSISFTVAGEQEDPDTSLKSQLPGLLGDVSIEQVTEQTDEGEVYGFRLGFTLLDPDQGGDPFGLNGPASVASPLFGGSTPVLESARFLAPGGGQDDWITLDLGEPVEGGTRWAFEITSEVETLFDQFGDGTYFIEFDFGLDGKVTTSFVFGNELGDAISDPAEPPALVNIESDEQDVPIDTLFEFAAITDANVTGLAFSLFDTATDEQVYHEQRTDTANTIFGPADLEPDTVYEWEIAVTSTFDLTNDDGVQFRASKTLFGGDMFETDGPKAELVGEFGNINLVDTLLAGEGGSVEVFVHNQGDAHASGAIRVDVYLTAGDSVDEDAVLVGTLTKDTTIDADANKSFKVDVVIPQGTAAGTYSFVAVVDAADVVVESNEANNETLAEETREVVDPVADIAAQRGERQFPGAVQAGHSDQHEVRIVNNGTLPIAGEVTIRHYLSTDDVLDEGDELLGEGTTGLSLGLGESKVFGTNLTFPAVTPQGQYVIITVVEPSDAVGDSDADNNTVMTDPIEVAEAFNDITLLVDTFSLNAQLLLPGSELDVTTFVFNQGNFKAKGDARVTLYASTDGELEGATQIGQVTKSVAVDLFAEQKVDVPVTLPIDLPAGDYLLVGVVEWDGELEDRDTENNTSVSASTFAVSEPIVDLSPLIEQVDIAAQVLPGATGKIKINVVNNGNIPSTKNVTLRVYASEDGELEGATQIGQIDAGVPGLNPQDSKKFTIDMAIPQDLTPGFYQLVVEVVEEDDANAANDTVTTAGALQVLAPFVDLAGVFEQIDLDPAPMPGDTGKVKFLVVNNGNITADGVVTVNIYAAPSGQLDEDAVLLGTAADQTVSLGPDRFTKLNIDLAMPETALGDFDLIAEIVTDIEESSTNNNRVVADSAFALADPFVDLGLATPVLEMPLTVIAGATGRVNVDLVNDGNIKALGTGTIRAYLSADDAVDGGDVQVGVLDGTAINVNPFSAKSYKLDLAVPADLPAGDYNLILVLDAQTASEDENDANETIVLGQTITVIEPQIDLTATVDFVDLPASTLPGVKGKVGVTIANQGNIDADGEVTLRLVASTDGVVDGGDVELALETTNLKLSPGQARGFNLNVELPGDMAAGEYNLILVLDEGAIDDVDVANNEDTADSTVTIEQPTVDLRADGFVDALGTRLAGDDVRAELELRNEGNVPVEGVIAVRFYLSTDDQFDDGVDTLIGDFDDVAIKLNPFQSKGYKFDMQLPADTPDGDYRIVAVIDADDVVEESDEDNNALASNEAFAVQQPVVDATIAFEQIDLLPAQLLGSTGKARVVVTNEGNVQADGTFTIRIYASADGTLDGGDTVLSTLEDVTFNNPPNSSRSYNLTLAIPEDLAAGDYQLIAVVDDNDNVTESDEANNTAVSADAYTFSPPFVDLTPQILTTGLGDTFVPGDETTIEVAVRNLGNVTAVGSATIRVYASTDDTLDGGDTLLAELPNESINLKPGQERSHKVDVVIPDDLAEGDYFFIAEVVAGEGITDADAGNDTHSTDTSRELALKFGTVGGRDGVELVVGGARFSIKGAGTGTVVGGANFDEVVIDGSDEGTRVSVEGDVELVQVTVNGSIREFSAPQADLMDGMTVANWAGLIEFDDVADQHLITVGTNGDEKSTVEFIFDQVVDLTINTATAIKSLFANRWIDTDGDDEITAPRIDSLTVTDNFMASLTLTDATAKESLGKASVGGFYEGVINAATHLGKLAFGGLRDADIYAGVTDTSALPDALDDFDDVVQSTVKGLDIVGIEGETDTVINSNIAAWSFKKVNLRDVQLDNGDTPFGLAAVDPGKVTLDQAGVVYDYPDNWLENAGDLVVREID